LLNKSGAVGSGPKFRGLGQSTNYRPTKAHSIEISETNFGKETYFSVGLLLFYQKLQQLQQRRQQQQQRPLKY